MIVHITGEAEHELERIGDYIAQDSPKRALTFVRELREQCLSLTNMPLAFPLVPRYEVYGIRRRAHGNYLIFYRVEADRVVVLHVLHGVMDYAAILFQDEA
ncbi:MAG TPA: type II toxin-antitoxin system RelE/ParE family toxin [Eoetvoesiella sp.]